MSVQQQELDETQEMIHPDTQRLFSRIKAERDLYQARYECLKNLCGFEIRSIDGDWCALRGFSGVVVEKHCYTVDEAVDFVLGGNGV